MLEKLAAIANIADNNGHYEVASEVTQLLKNAQIFDALKTLFDPSSSELGVDSGFLNRLTRGWRRGKFDRRLGLALAINEERNKLNRKIQEMAEPIKTFADEISAFYDKVKSGADDYNSQDFRQELKSFKDSVRHMQKLVGDKKLRKALDLRNKLNSQQIAAVEKITGLDPEHKDFLIKLFNGEIKSTDKSAVPGASPAAAQAVPGQMPAGDQLTPEQQRIRTWLKSLPMPKMEYDEGLTSNRARGLAWTIFTRWGRSPMAMKTYFEQHPDKQEEGAYLFGKPFRKVFIDINDVMKLEKNNTMKTPAAGEEAPKAETKQEADNTEPNPVAPEAEVPPGATVSEEMPPSAAGPIPTGMGGSPTNPGKKPSDKAKETVREYQKREQEKTVSPADDKLAASAGQRLEREITRLGRMQRLKKFSN